MLDASAVVEVVARLRHRDWVLDRLAEAEPVAPAHQLVEVSSALARLERAGVLTAAEGEAAAVSATELPQRVQAVDGPLLRRAYALRGSLRLADAFYVAVAERFGVPLVTTDARLARAEPPCAVMTPHGTGA